jgi:hypothetical protein
MKAGNILYIHIPRTAGTHFEKALGFKGHDFAPRCGSVAYGANYEEVMGWDTKSRIMLQHATYRELIKHRFISKNDGLIKITIVRNPYHRVISLYKYFGGHRKWQNFENFLHVLETGTINGYFYMPQWKYIDGGKDFNIIKFENFLIDLEAINKKFNININATFRGKEQENKSKKAFNEFFKTQDTIDRVSELYRQDFEALGYLKGVTQDANAS